MIGVGGLDAAVDPFEDYHQPQDQSHEEEHHETASPPLSLGSAAPASPQQQLVPGRSIALPDDENSPLRIYQREHQKMLAEREAKSREEHDKLRAAARADVEKFYEERRQKREQNMKHNRITSEGAKGDKASATASGWARCVELIDLNAPKAEGKETKDVSRMRKLLLEAKHGDLPLRAQ